MDRLILDRRGPLLETPPFLALAGERERSLARLPGFIALCVVLATLGSVAVVVVILIIAGVLMGADGQSFTEALATLMDADRAGRSLASYAYEFSMVGLSLFAAAIAIIGLASRFYQRPMRSFLTVAPRFRWRLMLLGIAVATPIIALAVFAELAFSGVPLEPPILRAQSLADGATYVAIAVVFLFLAALAEEMIFRGWLLQQTGALTRNLFVILAVNGVLFSLIHLDPDPGAFVVRAVMGAGWAWIALRLGGVEFGTGAHLANNMAVTLFVQPLTLTPPTGEATDYRSVLVQLAIVAVTIAVVERIKRNKVEGGALTG
jgi:membrane protease YdiL (CAAX protease family)